MNQQPASVELDAKTGNNILPVYQKPEAIIFGGGAVLMALSVAANIAEMTQEGINSRNIFGAVAAGCVAAVTGHQANKSYKETIAYNNSSDVERDSPVTLDRRSFVRNIRTLNWGGSTILATEVGLIGITKAAESGSASGTVLGIGAAGVGALVGTKTAKNFFKSRKQGKELSNLQAERRAQQNPNRRSYVSTSYQRQLSELASELANPQRYSAS